jgi:hypothetical protein
MKNELESTRLSISLGDFKQARKFVSLILRRQLHSKTRTDYVELLHLAFNTSLIISYSRPFSWNSDLHNGRSSLKSLVPRVLTPDEIALHNEILELRNTAYGHSDASSHLLPQIDYARSGLKLMIYAFTPLNYAQTRRLNTMLRKWIEYLEAERNRLKTL